MGDLYVIAVIFNPCKYESRYRLYFEFEQYIADSGALLYTTELSYDGAFAVTDPNNPRHLQFHGRDRLWHKENLINLTLKRLPDECRFVAWIDADLYFDNENWVCDTVAKLKTSSVIQLFYDSYFLNRDGQTNYRRGFSYSYFHAHKFKRPKPGLQTLMRNRLQQEQIERNNRGGWVAPGLAWAARKDFLDHTNGLAQKLVYHTGDALVADALYKNPIRANHSCYEAEYNRFSAKAHNYFANTGLLPSYLDHTKVFHKWHGSAENRRYYRQTEIFDKYQIDPDRHILEDEQGVYYLSADTPQGFREDMLRHFEGRNEDE